MTHMSWLSRNSDMIWLFGLPWLLPVLFLIFGFVVTIGSFTGIHIYSRRWQKGDYWRSWFGWCVLIIIVEVFYWNLFFGAAK